MRTEYDLSRVKFKSFEEDSICIDGHLFLAFFVDHWTEYDWEKNSLPKAWAHTWTRGSQARGFQPEAERAMLEIFEDLDMTGQNEIMSREERKMLESLQSPLSVFRGVCLNVKEELDLTWPGCSWTVDREKAEWFARRYGETPALLTMPLADRFNPVVACFLALNEAEVVVDCRIASTPSVTWL